MKEKEGNYLFIGTVVGIALVLGIGWYVKSTEPSPTLSDCMRACENESWNRPTSWLKECEEACLGGFKVK